MVAPGVEIVIVSKAQFTAEGLVMPLLGGGIVPWFAVASLMGQQREVSPWTVMAGGVFAAVTMGVFVVSGARSLPWYLRNKPSILQKKSALARYFKDCYPGIFVASISTEDNVTYQVHFYTTRPRWYAYSPLRSVDIATREGTIEGRRFLRIRHQDLAAVV